MYCIVLKDMEIAEDLMLMFGLNKCYQSVGYGELCVLICSGVDEEGASCLMMGIKVIG